MKIFKKSGKAFKKSQKLVPGLRGFIEVLDRAPDDHWKAHLEVLEECHSGGNSCCAHVLFPVDRPDAVCFTSLPSRN